MEFIDNHPVVAHRVRFTDRTEITDQDAHLVRDGSTVVWIVQASCQPPSYHPTGKDSEDRYRFNIQKVHRAAVLTGVVREQAMAYLADPSQRQGYFGFEAPRYSGDEDVEPEPYDADVHMPQGDLPLFELGELYPADKAEPVGFLDHEDSVEVVGSIYRPGHESPTQKLLRETWGER
jgi:hypothetical protein